MENKIVSAPPNAPASQQPEEQRKRGMKKIGKPQTNLSQKG